MTSHRSFSRDRELLGKMEVQQLHDRTLILAFNSPRKIPLPPNPNYPQGSSRCWPNTTADARVSGQSSGHDLEPQGPLLSQSQTQALRAPWEGGWAALPGRAVQPRPGRAAAAPVWRQGERTEWEGSAMGWAIAAKCWEPAVAAAYHITIPQRHRVIRTPSPKMLRLWNPASVALSSLKMTLMSPCLHIPVSMVHYGHEDHKFYAS